MRAQFVLAALLLAGCSQSAPQPAAECTEGECLVVVDEDVPGAIRGVVVDATITPVAGANVSLLAGGGVVAQAISSDAGAFSFRGLAPGFYFIKVDKDGFEDVQSQAEVAQGTQADVRIIMPRLPAPVQTSFTILWSGLMGCSVRVPAGWAQVCSVLDDYVGPPFADDSVGRFYDELVDVQMHPDHLQIELVWESTQALGEALTLMTHTMAEDRRYGTRLDSTDSVSPIIVRIDGATTKQHSIGAGSDARGILMQVWAGSGGNTVGATYQQDFEMFMTPFYGYVPPADWTFVSHGEARP